MTTLAVQGSTQTMAKRAYIAELHPSPRRGSRHLPVLLSDAGRRRYPRRRATATPIGNATTASFDALNRVVTTIAPDTGKTTLAYDGQDNVLTNTDPVTVATKFTYDGFGDVIQEVSPDRGTSTYVYNAAGQLTKSTDGRAQVVTYTLDLLGRVTTKVPTSLTAQTVTYTWDTGGLTGSYGVGRLGKMVDGSGTTQFQYDPRGNLLAKQQKIGTTTAAQVLYAYDLNNRITQITYPSGRIVQYAYDTKGRVSLVQTKASASITPWTTIASGYTYEPFGAVDAITLGNGLAVANIWGADGLLTSRRLYKVTGGTNLSYLTYAYDADSNIGSITDQITAANTVLYGYDKVDRLSMAVSASTTSTAQTYAYTTATNKLATLTTSAGARTYTYDGRGNTSKEVRPASVTATTTYDGYARLTGYTRTDVGAYTFTYNGLDDRVTMTNSANGTRTFLYDGQARVLGEYGTSATDVKAEYIWALPSTGTEMFGGSDGVGGYAPLAVATPTSSGTIQLNWVFGNHLGVPLVTTDSTGALATTPNNYFLPGFPGQSRVIADLYYNRYRDYDPTTGRYIQADPIGLGGGSNPYAYAGNNPLRFTDPQGLQCNSQGCWTTPQESNLANSGNYNGYYNLACQNGDSYACYARHIADNDNISGHIANFWLNWAIDSLEKKKGQCFDHERLKQSIRIGLARRYANYLSQDPNKPKWPSKEGISQLHWDEFGQHGLPPSTFGGTPFGEDTPSMPSWCPNCQPLIPHGYPTFTVPF